MLSFNFKIKQTGRDAVSFLKAGQKFLKIMNVVPVLLPIQYVCIRTNKLSSFWC